jgi:hypothetical protein
LVHMHNRHVVINMTIAGEKTPAFSAVTLDLPPQQADESAQIIQHSRSEFSLHRDEVGKYIGERYGFTAKTASTAKPAAPKPPALVEPKPEAKTSEQPVVEPDKPKPVTKRPEKAGTGMGRTAVVASDVEIKLKRKRRRRNKKPVDSLAPDTEKVIFLNRE